MSEQPRPGSGETPSSGSDFVALTRSPGFWAIMRYAALFGVVLAFAALAFLALVKGGTKLWFTLPKNPDWFDGRLWWVAVTAAAGVLVGVLRRFLRVPVKLPGTVEELKDQRVEPSVVLKAVAVSLVSLAGGASLGPEDALGKMGGGLGTWISERRKLTEEARATNTLSGMSGAYGGLLSSPLLASILTLEIARPKAQRAADTLAGGLLSASVAFAVYFAIAGSTFVGIYTLPSYKYEDWQLLAAIPLGLAAGALALLTIVAVGLVTKLTAPLVKRTILRSTIGGIAFGLVGVALPLTLFTGTDQLTTVIHDGAALGAGLLIAVVFAKMIVVRALRIHRLHRRAVPRDAVHRRHGRGRHARAEPGAPGGARVHSDVRRPSRVARRRPVLADPARRAHHPDRHPADRTGRDRRPHRLPCRLGLGSAHVPVEPRAQAVRREREGDDEVRAPRLTLTTLVSSGAEAWSSSRH